MPEIIRSAFSGEGAIIFKIMGLAVGSWIANYICMAVKRPDLGKLAYVSSILVSFGLVLGTLASALGKAAKVMGF